MRYRRNALIVGSVFCLPMLSAADASAQAGSARADRSVIDEVIVTARKREESLQDIGGSISAITADQMATAQIISLQDVRDMVPNLYLEEDLGGQTTTKIFVRGIGIDNPDVSFDSPIGIYVDGVYHARAFGSLVDTYDVERIEFLRGPQGTLYGRNNSAGALRIITKAPNLEEVEAGASLGFGTEGQFNASGFWSVPLQADRIGLRLALASRRNDGFMTETNSGGKFKNNDMLSGRASVLIDPNDEWKLTLRADFLADDGAGSLASSIVPAFNTDGDIYTATTNLTPDNSLDVRGTSATINRRSDRVDITSITAFRDIKMRNSGGDADGTPLSLLEGAIQNLDEDQFSQEFFVTPGAGYDGGIFWTAGLFYFNETNDVFQSFNVFPAVFGPATTQVFELETESVALYAEADFELSDRLALIAGARYTDEKKETAFDSFNNDGSFGFSFADSLSVDKTTWKLGVEFAIAEDVLLFATAGTGFRSGGIGINPAARSPADVVSDVFEPEEAESYEGGIKSTFLDGSLQLNATYFHVDYESLQLAVAGAGGITVNTPDATVHGLEADLTVLISENFTVNLTLGTQNDDIDQSDLKLKNTPDWQARLGVVYSTEPTDSYGSFTFAADYSYKDDYFGSTANSILIDGHPLVNARIGWDSPQGRWGASVSVNNLTDEYYPIHGFRIIPGLLDNQFPNYPRRWMAEVHFSY